MGLTSRIERKLAERAKRLRLPITVNLELSPACNLNCKMCYICMDMHQIQTMGGLKTADEWISLAQELRKENVLFLLLTGGEVFIYPEFRRLYETLYDMGFMITINTNATLIDEDTAEWLHKYPPKCVSISLYGASDETYERVCGQRGIFSKVNRAIELLMLNHIRIELKTVITPLNVCDMEACWRYAKDRGIFYETSTYAFPPVRKVNAAEQIRFTPEQAVQYQFESNRMLSTEEGYKEGIVNHLKKYEDTRNHGGCSLYGFTCGASNSSCWITWQGHMTPCALLNEPFTNPFESGFKAAWEMLKHKSDQILMSPKCSNCDKRGVCTVCPAANYAETGCFDKASPFHCRMTSLTLEEMKRYVGMNDAEENL